MIARDRREPVGTLAEAFSEGALAYRTSVADIGMTTMPMLYYPIIDKSFDGEAMVSVSHLPARYNGTILCREQVIPLEPGQGFAQCEREYEADWFRPS